MIFHYYFVIVRLMDRWQSLFGNPLILYLAVVMITYSLVGFIRRVQYIHFGINYVLTGSQAVKFSLFSILFSLLLVIDYFLYSSSSIDFVYSSSMVFILFAATLGLISYLVMYLLDKRVKYSRKPSSDILFSTYLYPSIFLLIALFALFKTL